MSTAGALKVPAIGTTDASAYWAEPEARSNACRAV
jgi:hypothetical protein